MTRGRHHPRNLAVANQSRRFQVWDLRVVTCTLQLTNYPTTQLPNYQQSRRLRGRGAWIVVIVFPRNLGCTSPILF